MENITEFLIEAKKNTYANENVKHAQPSRQGSKDYEFELMKDNKKMIYHDTYFGGANFIGEEVIYLDSKKPIWGMNYYGYLIISGLSEELVDKVLRPALMQVGVDDKVLPLRGPSEYKNGDYLYTFESKGSIDCFTGIERIYKDNKLIYQLHCAGGCIK